jgi:hypothetical protein
VINNGHEKRIAELQNEIRMRRSRMKAIDDLISHLTPSTLADHIEYARAGLNNAQKLLELNAEKDTLSREIAQLTGELAMLAHSAAGKKTVGGKSRGQLVYDAVEKLKKSKSGKGKTNEELFELLAEDWNEVDNQAIRKAYYDYQSKKLTGKQTGRSVRGDSKDKTGQGNQGPPKLQK